MEFPFFSGTDKKKNTELVFDVGSGSVGVALVSFSVDKPEILYSHREPIAYQAKPSGVRLNKSAEVAVGVSAERVKKDGFPHLNFSGLAKNPPKTAHIILSAPWHFSHFSQIKLRREKNFRVSKDLVSSLIADAKSGTGRESFGESNDKMRLVPIEEKILSFSLNGYETNNPFGKEALALQALVFWSYAPEFLVQGFQKAILNSLHVNEVIFHSFSLLASLTVRNVKKPLGDFVFADVGAEITELVFVKSGVPSASASFPLGSNSLFRSIMRKEKGAGYFAVSGILRLMREGKYDSRRTAEIAVSIDEVSYEWGKEFKLTYESLTSGGLYAGGPVYLIADEDVLSVFTSFVRTQFLKSDEKVFESSKKISELSETVVPIKDIDFDSLLALRRTAERDSFLEMEAIFLSITKGAHSIFEKLSVFQKGR